MAAAPINESLVFDSVWFERRNAPTPVLNGVFLRLDPGHVCGLFGLTGSGRSTLLQIAAGQLRPSGGAIFIDGVPCSNGGVGNRFSSIAYLPQHSFLPHDALVRTIFKAFPIGDADVAADAMLRRIISQRVGSLTPGERRYLEARLILSLERKYILLDEPFTGVEPVTIEATVRLIAEQARRGKGVLLTDHSYHYVLSVADESYLMCDGQCRKLDGGDVARQLHSGGYL